MILSQDANNPSLSALYVVSRLHRLARRIDAFEFYPFLRRHTSIAKAIAFGAPSFSETPSKRSPPSVFGWPRTIHERSLNRHALTFVWRSWKVAPSGASSEEDVASRQLEYLATRELALWSSLFFFCPCLPLKARLEERERECYNWARLNVVQLFFRRMQGGWFVESVDKRLTLLRSVRYA